MIFLNYSNLNLQFRAPAAEEYVGSDDESYHLLKALIPPGSPPLKEPTKNLQFSKLVETKWYSDSPIKSLFLKFPKDSPLDGVAARADNFSRLSHVTQQTSAQIVPEIYS